MSTSQRIMGWKPNYNNPVLNPSRRRPFEKRKEVPFQRPPAKYDNPSWEDNVARVEEMPVGKKKKTGKA